MVCCSRYVPESVLPDQQNYARAPDAGKIYGAVDAQIHEFPWMVLLEYRNRKQFFYQLTQIYLFIISI